MMKRVCKQHGISRWSCHKINKVNCSVTKLRRVIESVQGGTKTFIIPSMTTTPPPLGVDSTSCPMTSNGSPTDQLGSLVSNLYDPSCRRSELTEKSEKPISLEVLQQHLAGSLKKAAKKPGELDEELSEIGFLKTFKGNRLLTILEPLEEEKRPVADECITISAANCKTTPILLPREDIEQQYGRTIEEAAKNLNVSLSTLKRKCKDLHISEWQGPNFVKRKENEPYKNQTDTNEADSRAIRGSLAIKAGTYFNENTLTIKAEYVDDLIKFHMPISLATFEAIKKEICDRFKLRLATYKLKYQNEDKEWILMTSEEDLIDCIKSMRNLNGTSIRLRVLLLT